MTTESPTNSEETPPITLAPDRVKAKADILETNIYNTIKQSGDGVNASFEINRQDDAAQISEVVVKAVQQLLESFDLPSEALAQKLGTILKNKIDDTKGLLRLKQTFRSKSQLGVERNVSIGISSEKIIIDIYGTPPVGGINGDIREYFFEHENYPGKILPNGKIDFREINRFPTVEAGADLMLVNYPKAGKPGITYSGTEIQVPAITDVTIELHEGVERIEKLNQDGNPDGYLIRSTKQGVIVLTKKEGRISAINVTDHIEVNEIDYSIGNIGSEFISPVSLTVGTINQGFRVKVNGEISVKILNGGEVHTKSTATFDQIQPGSFVYASQNITSRIIINSELQSPRGSISIGSELRDSTLSASRVEFIGTRGLVLNTKVETQDLAYNNVSVSGDNFICLGQSLFETRSRLLKEKTRLSEKIEKVTQLQVEIKNHLVGEIKELYEKKKDRIEPQHYKLLIQSLQTFTFNNAILLLDNLKKQNVISTGIASIRKNFHIMQQLQDGIGEASKRMPEIEKELAEVEQRLNTMKFSITGKIKPAGSIKIFCTKDGIQSEPAHNIDPNQKQGDKLVSVSGRYSLETGLIINQ